MKKSKISLLMVIAILFTYCGGKTDKDLFENAESLLTEKKYSEAVAVFENLVE